MLVNLSNNDSTQREVFKQLSLTEELISKVATKLSKSEQKANIYGLPDLGISSNVTRMLGGFFTGMCATWNTTIPFIPVDATVNVCGTAVYKLHDDITTEEFEARLRNVFTSDNKYNWNYNRGNHFVILAKNKTKGTLVNGQYLVLHASAAEYKKDNLKSGLYPVKGNWFYDKIQTERLENGRYLRYISGKTAEEFYKTAEMLLIFNKKRNTYLAEKVLGKNLEKEIVNVSHYGMPDINTICIGCQWEKATYTLLTAPGKDIYIVEPKTSTNNLTSNGLLLSPHGFGVEIKSPDSYISLSKDFFEIDGKVLVPGESINIGKDATIRGFNESSDKIQERVNKILEICSGKVTAILEQIACYNKSGFSKY